MVDTGSRKLGDFLTAAVILLLWVNLNLLISGLNLQIDLTRDKKHTLSKPVKQLLKGLDDVVYIDVYLEGDFPPGFQRLKNAARDMLNEFRDYGGTNIQYNFIDPDKIQGPAGKNDLVKYLGNLGIQPTNLFSNENGRRTEKLIFPGAVISYGGRESGVMLLKGNKAGTPEERLNQSIEGMEYELASGIGKLVNVDRKRIGMVTGNGELDSLSNASAVATLKEYYDVFNADLNSLPSLKGFDALVMAKPATPFSEMEIYKLDQYVMNGGRILFFIDVLHVDEDSISREGTIGYPMDLNLDDLLFRYGVRINKDFVLDLNAGAFPVVTDNLGNSPKFQLMQWPFYPLLNQFGNHPIVRNMDAIYSKYVSSIDTVKAGGIRKIPLVFSSPYTRLVNPPVRVSLNDLRAQLKPELFNHGPAMVSCLLEGTFTSLFKNRFLPGKADRKTFKAESLPTRMVVCSDGDIIRSNIDNRSGAPYELGYDPFMKVTFANRDFLLNAVSYLLDENGLILSRSREVTMRPLDKIRISEDKTTWQMINLALPVVVVIIFGITRAWFRKRKFSGSR